MPPKSRRRGAKKVRRKEKKNVAHGHAHIKSTFNNTIVSITDPTGAVISWASAGQVGFKGSRKSTPFAAQMAAEAAARRAQEHGMRKVDVFVKGPGSGRETAIRSLQATGLEVGSIQDVTPIAAQRLPSAQAPPRLSADQRTIRRRPHGSLHRRRLQALPPREDEAVPQGRQVRVPEVPDRDPALPAGRARPRRAPRRASTCCRCGRSRSARASTASSRSSSAATTRRPTAARQDRREPAAHPRVAARQRRLPGRLRQVPRHGPPARPARPHHWSTATRSTSRRYRVSENDIVEVRAELAAS